MKVLIIFLILISKILIGKIVLTTERHSRLKEIKISYDNKINIETVIIYASETKDENLIKDLVSKGILVISLNSKEYINILDGDKTKCSYPAGDLENLSKDIQHKFKFSNYIIPILLGEGKGGSLFFGTLTQSPKNTFKGLVTLRFENKLLAKKKFCPGSGLKMKGNSFDSFVKYNSNWINLYSNENKDVTKLVGQTNGAKEKKLEKSKSEEILNAFSEINKVSNVKIPSLDKLPLVEVPINKITGTYFVVFYSGDGGWAGVDEEIASYFIEAGIPVIGLNSLKYFWAPKDPLNGSEDLASIIKHYSQKLNLSQVMLVGFSFGADVLSFFISRLPIEIKAKIIKVALLGLGKKATFEFHFSDWLGGSNKGEEIHPELNKISQMKVYCAYGDEEKDSLCTELNPKQFNIIKLSGGHHFHGEYQKLFNQIK